MAILRSNLNNELQGFAANMKLREAINNKLYAQAVVIKKFEAYKDRQGNIQMGYTYGTIGINPVAEAFGLNYDRTANNLDVEVKSNVTDEVVPRRIDVDGERYVFCDNIVTMKCKNPSLIKKHDKEGFTFEGETYKLLGASPSNEKKAVKFFYRVTKEVPTERAAFDIMDRISGEVFSYKFSQLIDGKTITKLNTRWGNYLTTMKCMAEIDLTKDYIAVVFKDQGALVGAYDFDETTRKQMKAVGIDIDNHINDGAVIHTVPCMQEIAGNVGVKLSDKDAVKVALQMRETVMTAKVMCITMTEEDALAVAENNGAVYFGNRNGRLMGVYDEDGAKAINLDALNNKETIKLYVLAQAKASEVRTNGQHLIKYMAVNPEETIAFLKQQFSMKLNDYVVNKLNDVAKMQTVNARLIDTLGAAAVKDTALMETIIKDMTKYAQSAIAKTKVEIDGVYSHMSFDWTYALTNGAVKSLLDVTPEGIVEAYSADVNKKLAKETKAIENNPNLTEEDKAIELFRQRTGIVIKHPSAMPDEYEIVYYMTEKQMKQRIADRLKAIKSNKVKAELKARLTRYVDNTPWGVTVYAPLNAMKNKLAGADVDFDATLTDMSDLKFILINERKAAPAGYMGKCTFISYKNIDRANLDINAANEIDC